MPRMIELIRASAVPASLMQAAARGALSVPPGEMIEILVHLANHNRIFGQQARMTLAGWDEAASLAAAADPTTSREVLDYLIAPENLRPHLLSALVENPSIPEETLMSLAASGSREVVDAMRGSPRVQKSPRILSALSSNANLTQNEGSKIHEHLAASGFEEAAHAEEASTGEADEADEHLKAFLDEHSKELAAEGEKPFQPIGGIYEAQDDGEASSAEVSPGESGGNPPISLPGDGASLTVETGLAPSQTRRAASLPAPAEAQVGSATQAAAPTAQSEAHTTATTTAATPHPQKKVVHTGLEQERGSALQKISRLDIKGRIQLAMKGTKEERSILVRDGTKLVALAVLESPKVTDGEVEKFASQKNVLEALLRQITMKRRFMKNYAVVRNLVYNPRTPLDISLGLMKNILVGDLRNLASNKEVSDTIRKLALKMFKQKSNPTKKSMD